MRERILAVRVDEETLKKLDQLAYEQERTRSAVIRFLIRQAAKQESTDTPAAEGYPQVLAAVAS